MAQTKQAVTVKGGLKKGGETWKLIQQRTFTNWVNDKLRGPKMVPDNPVVDLQVDLKDGIRLIELLEVLAYPRKVGRFNKKPKIKAQYLENLGTALEFIKREKIKLVNISESWLPCTPVSKRSLLIPTPG